MPIDKTSQTWAAISAWADHKQNDATVLLRTQGLNPVETEAARAVWWMLEGLMRLPEMIAEIERRSEAVERLVGTDDYGMGDDPA